MKNYRGAEPEHVVETCFHKNWEAEEPGGVHLLPTLHDRAGLVSRALPHLLPASLGAQESGPVCSASSMQIAVALGMPTLSTQSSPAAPQKTETWKFRGVQISLSSLAET